MNDVQQVAIAKADAMIRPAMELYEHRNAVSCLVGRLSLPDLKRLTRLLPHLTPDNWRELAAQAEALAAWNGMPPSSPDAQVPQQDPAPPTGG